MIIRKEDNLFVIKIFKNYLNGVDIFDKESIISLFKDILTKLNKKYDLCGFFDISVYINDNYGMIMEIYNVRKYEGEIDVKINFNIDCIFLYEINDIIDSTGSIYYYNDKYYSDCISDCYDSYVMYKESIGIINNGVKVK